MKIAFVAAFAMSLAPAAFARDPHCVAADHSEMPSATNRKDCRKAGGKWMKPKVKKAGGGGEATASATPK